MEVPLELEVPMASRSPGLGIDDPYRQLGQTVLTPEFMPCRVDQSCISLHAAFIP